MDSKKIQFLAGLVGGVCLSLLGQKLIQHRKQKNKEFLKQNYQEEEEQELLKEQLVRNIQFFGESQTKIEKSHIMVFGVGGVGSHVVSAISRSGVKRITIIDFDRVTLSSLNRHAIATRKDVGKSKVEIFTDFIAQLNPTIKLKTIESYITPENIGSFFEEDKPDYVIDCIDNIDAKIALITYCVKNQIKIIVCCGAGMKCDPTRIQIRDISESQNDDLARAIRMRLKKLDIRTGFNVVYSTEVTDRQLLPLQEHQKGDPDKFRVMPNYRLRIVPVFGCMPALFAQALAAYVLCDIAGCAPATLCQNDIKMPYFIQQIQLLAQQAKKNNVDLNIDIEDLVVIYKAYNGQCLVKDKKARPIEFIQFDKSKDITPKNIILLSSEEAKKHKEGKIIYTQTLLDRKLQYDQLIQENLGKRIII
ncbi:unnamed protein product [Paramecium pentaurelia]|uniref:THIF-type NAD/FAD binding fold domain-containing protein n=1 Tax=Paramecium pentaurelia TaxID=43138 RepID=A0A8S1U2S8_9CILI|nr:unnamed protein product [Paramecium pentaurelia]